MAEEEQSDKTEHPTAKRLIEARERGQLPISREVSAWGMMLGILIVIAWIGPWSIKAMMLYLRGFLELPHAMRLDAHNLQTLFLNIVMNIAQDVGLIFLVMMSIIILGIMIQTGPFMSLELIKFDIMRLLPTSGYKKLFSIHAVVEIIKSFGKMIFLGSVAYVIMKPLIDDLPGMTGGNLLATMDYLHQQAVHLVMLLLLVFTVIAAGDWFFQNHQYIKSLRMTKEEVKDEFRQQEGDPAVKGRLRQIRLEKARKRMMAKVPSADVVITNPTHYALALKYDNKKNTAPIVLAKGTDRVAERIRAVADENKIPLVSNPPLARALYDTVEIDEEIPSQHYRAVAEIISYVYKLKRKVL